MRKELHLSSAMVLGRTADPDILRTEGGFDLISSRPTPVTDSPVIPRVLAVEEYAQAARNAIAEDLMRLGSMARTD